MFNQFVFNVGSPRPQAMLTPKAVTWQVKNYYREGQNPFDYGGQNPERVGADEWRSCKQRAERAGMAISTLPDVQVPQLQADLLLSRAAWPHAGG